MEVQGCRLPALKTPQTSPCSSQAPLRPRQTFLQLQQVPEAVAVSFYGGSRLPFASLENSPNVSQGLLPKRLPAAPRRHSGRGRLSCSSNKSLRPWQCPFMEVQGCRLPALKTPQTSPCSSQAPLRPRQTFLQLQQVPEAVAVSFYGGSRLPFASLENSPNPSLQLPGAHSKLAHASLRAAFLHAVGPRQPNGCYFCFVFVVFFSGTCHCLL